MASGAVLRWLLEEEQPAIRYLTLRELEGKSAADSRCREAKRNLPKVGWAAEILARRDPEGWWESDRNLYLPKYTGTNWQLLVLAELGLTRELPEIRASCELWMGRHPLRGGGVGGFYGEKGHLCFTGNMVRSLLRFGYGEDRRVRLALDWLVESSHPKGGWTCWSFHEGPAPGRNLDSWEGLSAFAAYPRSRWTAAMHGCVERGAEFFLDRELYRQGERYPPWFRFHWPVHYYYDLLVGLDLLTGLGYGDDRRLRFALGLLRKKRRADGRWNLDAVHPDVGGAAGRWYREHPKRRPTPLRFETVRRPSKMITFLAQRVLDRVDKVI
ncbi:MAG: hypothetical protein L3K07_01540 [Thermoplasmata archaeon]|nr:hypothetical protein [Thermoplasmata archaeon]